MEVPNRTDEEMASIDKQYAELLEWQEAYSQAKAQARKTLMLKLAKLEMEEAMPEYLKKKLQAAEEKLKDGKDDRDSKYFAFVTINPEHNKCEDYQALNTLVEKCVAKYWVTEYAYCYEQRSDNADDIFGLHSHMILIRAGKRPSELEREVRSTFSKCVGIPQLHINIQWKKKAWLQDKVDYMKGLKTGDGKDTKVEIDKKMREQLGIENYVSNMELFSKL